MCVCACTHTRQCRYRAVTQPHVCVCVTRGPQSLHTLAGGSPPHYLSGAGHAGAAWHWVQPSGASAGDEAKPGRVRSGDSSRGPAMARSSCSDGARAVGPGMAMAVPESWHQTPPRWAGGHSRGPSQCPRGSRRVQDACGPKACPGGAWVTAGAGSRCQGTPGGRGLGGGFQATTEEIGTCGGAGINKCHSGAWGWLGQCWWEPWGRGVLSPGGLRGGSSPLLGAL